jgi:acyl-coenzyme A thioesterase PaaI-like protein
MRFFYLIDSVTAEIRMFNKFKDWLTSASGIRRIINIYGPYLGAGVKVDYLDKGFREARVSMRLTWYNRNYVGTHFGGSLFSMIDPFYMLLLMNNLGREYIVWDASAEIDFVRPGRGRVFAHFLLTDEMLQEIKQKTASGEKFLPVYDVNIVDEKDQLVAKVRKKLYIRRKA